MKALIVALTLLATPVLAANADAPDKNVDKSNDAGGPTGNTQTDKLNNGQLDSNQKPPSSQDAPAAK